jgi:hypothetical protein
MYLNCLWHTHYGIFLGHQWQLSRSRVCVYTFVGAVLELARRGLKNRDLPKT